MDDHPLHLPKIEVDVELEKELAEIVKLLKIDSEPHDRAKQMAMHLMKNEAKVAKLIASVHEELNRLWSIMEAAAADSSWQQSIALKRAFILRLLQVEAEEREKQLIESQFRNPY